MAALGAFTFLILSWRDASCALVLLAYSLFLAATLDLTGLELVTPDLCVDALVYLAASMCLRFPAASRPALMSAGLGVILALAYFAKTAMMPLSLLLLGLLFAIQRPARSAAVAAITFLVVAAPLVFAISRQQGHLTLGEAGSINYTRIVERVDGPIPGPRLVSRAPLALDFRNTVAGAYPPQYNPVYFFGAFHGVIDWPKQWKTILQSLQTLSQIQLTLPFWRGSRS